MVAKQGKDHRLGSDVNGIPNANVGQAFKEAISSVLAHSSLV